MVLLAPPCAVCGVLLEQPTRGAVCPACWASILPITPPLCDACGDPLPCLVTATATPVDDSPPICRRCRTVVRAVSRARAVGPYDGALRRVVHALKYDARRSLAKRLGALMRVRGADVLHGASCVVPVPLHRTRQRERGFNQAEDLARHLGPPVVDALLRIRPTPPQAQLSAADRARNLEGAFAPAPAARGLAGATVVLVDDVSTTGATLEQCAAALKRAGVVEVRALTAARVVGWSGDQPSAARVAARTSAAI